MKSLVFLLTIVALCSYNVFASVIEREYNEAEDDFVTGDAPTEEDFDRIILEGLELLGDRNYYLLYTRKNPTVPQVISGGSEASLTTSNYDGSKPLKVIAHGWTGDSSSRVNSMVSSAFLETDDVNVIIVDWRILATGSYVSAAVRAPLAGRYVAKFLTWLINNGGGSWDRVHLIGYSLGAHLMGCTGREVRGIAKRVTGLDPAGPFWSNNKYALNVESGQYVEAIHTNILSRGIVEPIGHADFYPNGGRSQPGCNGNECSHSRAYELFASSVRTNHFAGRLCQGLWQALLNSCMGTFLNMGNGNLNKTGSGIYSLETRNSWPF